MANLKSIIVFNSSMPQLHSSGLFLVGLLINDYNINIAMSSETILEFAEASVQVNIKGELMANTLNTFLSSRNKQIFQKLRENKIIQIIK